MPSHVTRRSQCTGLATRVPSLTVVPPLPERRGMDHRITGHNGGSRRMRGRSRPGPHPRWAPSPGSATMAP
ncbi:hypothetical protein SGPA1_11857 [Streptomyces misionensis JCM 4497]